MTRITRVKNCEVCAGTGRVGKAKCTECAGEGIKRVQVDFESYLKEKADETGGD